MYPACGRIAHNIFVENPVARRISESELEAIEAAVRQHSGVGTARQIARVLGAGLPFRTLQYRLKTLVDEGRLLTERVGRANRYRLPEMAERGAARESGSIVGEEALIPLSKDSVAIRDHLRLPLAARTPVGYDRGFLDSYRPNESFYLSARERAHLEEVSRPRMAAQPAGTYARRILDRLLIDLSWNSSRLEGNTYSLLDTRRLIRFGEEAQGRARLESQMILNHKDAIEFLVEAKEGSGFNRYTILNLHAMLASNLLPDEAAAGRLRHIAVGIEGSIFHPLEMPPLIEECFDQMLHTVAAIRDPFEQALFFMVQLPYLQPFDDVNKRVSRLGANIPFIRENLCPLSFVDVPLSTYTEAVLGVYELNRTDLLKDVFIWACERSAARYAAVRQSIGEPDPFRLRYRDALREVVGEIVRRTMDASSASRHIASEAEARAEPADREAFRELAEGELLALHEGNFARYRTSPAEFEAWRQRWTAGSR